MQTQAIELSAAERLRTFLPSLDDRKGLLLSHLVGICLFIEFTLEYVVKTNIPLTPPTSIPIRLVGLWLIIDRGGRIGRLRFGAWDWIIISFIVLATIGTFVTASAYPGVPIDFEDFRRFVGVMAGAYLYYIIAKEGLNRRGFRPDITINWLLAGLAFSAMVGLMQALDLFHARQWSLIYADRLMENTRDFDTGNNSFASGTANWWTTMALEMVVAFGLAFGPTFRRNPKWWEWGLGMLFMAGLIATQSRGGLIGLGACAIGTFLWYVYHRRYVVATIIAAVFITGVSIWVFTVFALKIEKFTVSLAGEKVRGSEYGQSVAGRFQQQRDLMRIGMKQPLFGTGPNGNLLPGNAAPFAIWSPYAHVGATDTMYGYVFAQFGLVGLSFLVVMQGYLLAFFRRNTAHRPYAFTAFFVGLAFTFHGLSEFSLYQRTFIVMNVLAAYASAPDLVSEKGKAIFRRIVKGGPRGAALT